MHASAALDNLLGTGISAGDLGAGGLVVLFVLSIMRGWLVPRSVLEDVRTDRDVRVAEEHERGEQYRLALEETRRQVTALLDTGKTVANVMRALPADETEEGPP